MKNKFSIFLVKIFFLVFFFNTSYAEVINPKSFIQNVVNDAKKILVAGNSQEYKSNKLAELAKKNVDIRGIGLYTLGKYRKGLSEKDKENYAKIFEKYFLKSFTSRLSDYSDPKIKVISSVKKNEKYTIVSSVLLATDEKPEVKIDWRVYTLNPEKPLIRDLIIEGLSLARTQKEEFASIIENNDGNIKVLFKRLEEFINK
tara:strand:- start:490 stop:1092 length:603 start_codon:yes stop_codon:yes gene_type:complete